MMITTYYFRVIGALVSLFILCLPMVADALAKNCGTIVGSLPLGTQDLAISGSYAYIVNGYNSFSIVDIKNPSSPAIIGTCNIDDITTIDGVCVFGSYAYVSGYHGFRVVDVTNPQAPVVIGQTDVSDPYVWYKVAVSGKYAYTTMWNWGKGGFGVVNISNPLNPIVVGRIRFTNPPGGVCGTYDVKVKGNYAYATYDGANGSALKVIDVSLPRTPKVVKTIPLGDYPKSISIAGSYAFVTNWSTMYVVDIGDPVNSKIIGSITIPLGCEFGLYISNLYAFVMSAGGFISVVDVADPTNPELAFEIPGIAGGLTRGVAISGSYCYAGGFNIINITSCRVSRPSNHIVNGSNSGWSYPLLNLCNDQGICKKPVQNITFGFMSYNNPSYRYHYAQDITKNKVINKAYKEGDPVFAMANGKIIRVRRSGGYGGDGGYNTMLVQYNYIAKDGFTKPVYVMYGHVKNIKNVSASPVPNGKETTVNIPIWKYKKIAELNDPGATWNHVYHLHLSVMPDSLPNPNNWYAGYSNLQRKNGRARPFDCWNNSNGSVWSKDWVDANGFQNPANQDEVFFDTLRPR